MTTIASQLWCVQEHGLRGWVRISPVFNSQEEAEYAMHEYAPDVGRKAIRTAVFEHNKGK